MHSNPRRMKERELDPSQWIRACQKQKLCHSGRLYSRFHNMIVTPLFPFLIKAAQTGFCLEEERARKGREKHLSCGKAALVTPGQCQWLRCEIGCVPKKEVVCMLRLLNLTPSAWCPPLPCLMPLKTHLWPAEPFPHTLGKLQGDPHSSQ